MKLKYKFVIRRIGNENIAVAVGDDSMKFNGMIKLNKTGVFLFEELQKETSKERLEEKLIRKFGICEEQALADTNAFIRSLSLYNLIAL